MPESVLGPDNLSDTIPTQVDVYQVDVYTDGGCDPNPGPGGWGAIIRWKDREWVISGNDPATTNNRLELQAAALIGPVCPRRVRSSFSVSRSQILMD